MLPRIIHLSPTVTETFEAIDFFIWSAFVVEYLTKLYLSPSSRGFVTHHWLDLAAIAVPILRRRWASTPTSYSMNSTVAPFRSVRRCRRSLYQLAEVCTQ